MRRREFMTACGAAGLAGIVQTSHKSAAGQTPPAAAATATQASSSPMDQALQALLEEAWQFDLREDPLSATRYGDHRYNAELPRMTLEDIERRYTQAEVFLAMLETIPRAKLSVQEQINYDIFKQLTQDGLEEYGFRTYLMPITNRNGFHVDFPELPDRVPLATLTDYRNYISRLQQFLRYTREHIALMQQGVEEGLVLPAAVLGGFDEPIKIHIVESPEESLLYKPFKDENIPAAFSQAEREELRAAAKEAITNSIVPAYQEFLQFMTDTYVPKARVSVGASALPRGREFYRFRVRHFTTLADAAPEAVHEQGLSEVRRIREEMDQVIASTGFSGGFTPFVEFLRNDPKFYANTPAELLKEVSYTLKKMDGELPRLFSHLPTTPYGIKEIPAYIAPATTTAYYQQPAGDGSQAGFYFVNTYNLKSRPLYEVEALSLHEAVPGHHLQIAIQQELGSLPPIRRFSGFTVFTEGWALYAERLGLEVGFYQDPYSNFGRLSYEMWRACRLVVDTGMHYMGWTREEAIDFMATNSALSILNITNEVDRYISWPGQALAYKTGELKIRELRARAERELGQAFDLREFHRVVLGSGAVPLWLLDRNVSEYIASAR